MKTRVASFGKGFSQKGGKTMRDTDRRIQIQTVYDLKRLLFNVPDTVYICVNGKKAYMNAFPEYGFISLENEDMCPFE